MLTRDVFAVANLLVQLQSVLIIRQKSCAGGRHNTPRPLQVDL